MVSPTTTNIDDRKILLVDDEQDLLHTLKQGLEQEGFTVDAYSEPMVALENFKADHYKHIILDISLPHMNGFDLAHAIWARDSNALVCFLTAFEIYEQEANKVFKDLNTKCFIKKPIRATALVRHLKLHLRSSQ